jgi:hypothetical protein
LAHELQRFKTLLQSFNEKSFFGGGTSALVNQLAQDVRQELKKAFKVYC